MVEQESEVIYQEPECYRFAPDGKPYLVGSKCRLCGYIAFPPKEACPACVTKDSMEEIPLSSRGIIDSFSVLHVSAPGFKAPYILAYVTMPEGAKVLSVIKGCEPSESSIQIGTEVELIIDKIREDKQGNEVRGYAFIPVAVEGKET